MTFPVLLGLLSGSAPNGKITGANFLFVMPSGISLIVHLGFFLRFPLLAFFHFQNLFQKNHPVLSKIPVSLRGRSTFLYGVPGLR